jgi:hypothetical protein
VTRDEAKAILDGNRIPDDNGRYAFTRVGEAWCFGFNAGLEDALDALDAAGAFKAEPASVRCVCGHLPQEHDSSAMAGTTGCPECSCPNYRQVSAEPTITKAQAYEVARMCAISGGRHYWKESAFEEAWSTITKGTPK